MRVTNINIENINDGLSANSLAPAGPWKENRTYQGSNGISHVVIVGLGDNPAKWDMTKAKYFYAKEDNVNKHPSQHPEVWGEVPYFEYLIAASALVGKINADQIEASAFLRKFKELPSDYDIKDLEEMIKSSSNYYFILPEGNIRLPDISKTCSIPLGTEVTFLLPDMGICPVRTIMTEVFKPDFSDVPFHGEVMIHNEMGVPFMTKIIPFCSGIISFQVARRREECVWLISNYADIVDIDGMKMELDERVERLEDNVKADAEKLSKTDSKVQTLIDRTGVTSTWEDWSINGDTTIDLKKTSFIPFAGASDQLFTFVTLKNGNIGRNVIIETPEWNNKPVRLFVQFENGGQSIFTLPSRTQALYYVSFWGHGSECNVSKIATEDIPKE